MIQLPSPLVIELPLKGRIFIIRIMKKNKGLRAYFCGRAADSAHHLHFLRFLKEDWGVFQRGMKNSKLSNLHRDKAIRKQCDKDEAQMS